MWSDYGGYRQITFSEVWKDSAEFLSDYLSSGLCDDKNRITDGSAITLYNLMLARYGNDVLAPNHVDRFKKMCFAIVFQYGPEWEKRLEIQHKLRSMDDKELTAGNLIINNRADNPSVDPGTFSDEELTFINDQNVSKQKRGKLEAMAMLAGVLRSDYTQIFLDRFKKLFLTIVAYEKPLLYYTEEE